MKLKELICTINLILLLMVGCNTQNKQTNIHNELEFQMNDNIERAENKEVVCYIFNSYKKGGIWCYKK